MGKCVAKKHFFCAEWPRRRSKITFKTVDLFTKDLPARVIDAPVIVHTIEPLRRTNTEQRQGYGARNMSHSQAEFLDCHRVRMFAVLFSRSH